MLIIPIAECAKFNKLRLRVNRIPVSRIYRSTLIELRMERLIAIAQ